MPLIGMKLSLLIAMLCAVFFAAAQRGAEEKKEKPMNTSNEVAVIKTS